MSEAQQGDISPQEAAAALEGDTTPDEIGSTDGPVSESDGFPDDGVPDESPGLIGRLFSTEPNPPLEAVESPWNPDVGGPSRVFRGIQKIGDIDGLPAILDILIGLAETAQSNGWLDGDSTDDPDGDELDESDGDRLGGGPQI
jgi:hypothetical protein